MAAPDNRRRTVTGTTKGTANRKPDTRVEKALERLQKGVSRILDGEEFKRYLSCGREVSPLQRKQLPFDPDAVARRHQGSRLPGVAAARAAGPEGREGHQDTGPDLPHRRRGRGDRREAVRALVGFKTATVFDVSQTDGEPLPEAPRPEDLDPEKGAEIAEKVYEGLSRFCEAEGVAVCFEERRPGDYGSYQRKERRITLNAALPATERATTLAHELAHHLLHGVTQADGTTKQTREIEAEGAAYVVCAAFGLDTSRFTFAYVANYAGEPETLKAALERIQGAARRLIEAVEDSMEGGRS